ncbi:alpha/beta fold hydrolase [Pseudonocardia nigra]|uniref:alpha/beta fold hydrolase n=1 Tax=Pseudonocardia nigra TaxID=1921578 RepID=UPI001C5CDE6F|nr:alpha/beta hydrolase [Pseudonocardia nigra]
MTTSVPEHWRDPRLGPTRTVRLSGGTVEYHDRGDGPVLVFVHGYLVNANIWRELVPLLADRFRCITPDWPLGSHRVPMHRDADLSPLGIAHVIAELLDALELTDVTLIGNDSGGAYAQLAAAERPERLGRLVLNSCETPWCSWPPSPGGFGLLKAAAQHAGTHRALYQVLRLPSTWRWRNTYGWLAKYPIDTTVMRSYVRPVLRDPAIRGDGRKAIAGVSASYLQSISDRLRHSFSRPVLCAWAADDRVFPVTHAQRYARSLGADLRTIADSYTYTAEDQPRHTAEVLSGWISSRSAP